MPEGPSLVILREQAQIFQGKRVVALEGNSKIDQSRMVGRRIVALRTWGKHFLIEFGDFAVRIHLLMFGRYCINERKEGKAIRLGLRFDDGQELNFYACAVRYIEGDLDDTYDWRADVMSDVWDPAAAIKKLRATPDTLVCDALLDQNVFAGVGNIIKNEVLFRIRVHPCSRLGAIPAAKLREMAEEARRYSFQFLEWKQAFVLRKHWLVHNKGMCPRCEIKLTRAYLGTTDRRSFFCERCQVRYTRKTAARRLSKRPITTRATPIAASAKRGTVKQGVIEQTRATQARAKRGTIHTTVGIGKNADQTVASKAIANKSVAKKLSKSAAAVPRTVAGKSTAGKSVRRRAAAEMPVAVKRSAKSRAATQGTRVNK